jgi:hypothetical protein
MHSVRSPKITRMYLQVEPDDDLAKWRDHRIWDELQTGLATVDGFYWSPARSSKRASPRCAAPSWSRCSVVGRLELQTGDYNVMPDHPLAIKVFVPENQAARRHT